MEEVSFLKTRSRWRSSTIRLTKMEKQLLFYLNYLTEVGGNLVGLLDGWQFPFSVTLGKVLFGITIDDNGPKNRDAKQNGEQYMGSQ